MLTVMAMTFISVFNKFW